MPVTQNTHENIFKRCEWCDLFLKEFYKPLKAKKDQINKFMECEGKQLNIQLSLAWLVYLQVKKSTYLSTQVKY